MVPGNRLPATVNNIIETPTNLKQVSRGKNVQLKWLVAGSRLVWTSWEHGPTGKAQTWKTAFFNKLLVC